MHKDTIVAIATPVGESSVGVIRISGPDTLALCGKFLGGQSPGTGRDCDRIAKHRKLVHPESGEILDEALITFFKGPRSYTGEDTAEISCHGNPFILREVLNLLILQGARLANPGEFTQRAYLNGRMDLTKAEAVNDLIRAHTRYAMLSALSHMEGRFGALIGGAHSKIMDLLALLEAAIDHSDLEETFAGEDEIERMITAAIRDIADILKTAPAGKIMRTGVRLAITGAPNTGKSSLMNALLKEDRVIVSETPGTTRDTVEDELNVRGIPVKLIDTAGLRATDDPIEKKGMGRAQRAAEEADLRIVVFDASRTLEKPDMDLAEALKERKNIYVLNKTDLPEKTGLSDLKKQLGVDALRVSAATMTGIDKIELAVFDYYFSMGFNPAKDVLVANARQENLLREAENALLQALSAAKEKRSEEFIASDVRRAREAVEEITGKTTDDAVLDRIFSRFCIGK